MALTPSDNDAFFREVDDEVRRDRLSGFFARWGRLVIAAIVVGLAALALFLWWQNHRAHQAGLDGEALTGALADLQDGRTAPADAALAKLADSPRDGYRAAAKLSQAAALATRNDAKGAAAAYDAIAADTGLPQPMRDLALVRAVAAGFDTLPAQAVIDRLKPLAVPGNPWFGSAGEMTAAAWVKLNRPDRAGPLLASIARDGQAPASLRARAASLATSMGQVVEPVAAGAALKE